MKTKLLVGILILVLGVAILLRVRASRTPLAEQLISLDDNTRNLALARLPRLDEDERKKTSAQIVALPVAADARARRLRIYALRLLGDSSPEAIALYARLLSDPDASVREEASIALLGSGESALPTIIDLLGSPEPVARREAVRILTRKGTAAVPALTEALDAKNPDTRISAAIVLSSLKPPPEKAIVILTEALKKPAWDAQMIDAVLALGKMGPAAKSAVPALNALMSKAKESYIDANAPRPAVARALNQIDPRRAELVDLKFDLKQKNPVIRYRAAYRLSEANPPTVGAVSMLIESLVDSDLTVAARAMVALVRIGLDNTERAKAVAYPRMKSVLKRGKAAGIEGFAEIVEPAMKKFGI